MVRAVIFDADGMIVKGERFSDRLFEEYGISLDLTSPFFKNEFQLCLTGKADLKEELSKYLPKWGWDRGVDEILRFWFDEEHNKIDERFYPVIEELKKNGVEVYLATNNEKYRTDNLVIDRGLGKYFDKIFSSSEIGFKKPEAEFFEHIVMDNGFDRQEIVFWDDDVENVEGASSFGFAAEIYMDFDTFRQKMEALA